MKQVVMVEALDLSEAQLDAENRTVRQRIITSGRSANGRHYSEAVLQGAAALFEGVKTYADHPGKTERRDRPERSVQQITGWLESVEYRDGALYATRHFTANEAGRDVWALVAQIVEGKAPPSLLGGSISAYGRGAKQDDGDVVVEAIEHVISVDDVTSPAAGGGFLPLAASAGDDLLRAVIEDMTFEEWFESRPDYVRRVQNEMKKVRQTDAVKAASAEADRVALALQEAEQQVVTLEETNTRLLSEVEAVRRELALERALHSVRLPAVWLESLRKRLMEAAPEQWQTIINDEKAKASASAAGRVPVTGAGQVVAQPVHVPVTESSPSPAPRDNEDYAQWRARLAKERKQ